MTLTTPSSSHRRVLIVGCGYLGERAARRWLTDGAEVWTVTRSPQRAEEWRRQGFHPVVADLLKPVQWPDLPEFDMMLYAVGFDRTSGATKREVYVNGLEPLLAVLSPRVRRWVYVSSTSVYGQSAGEWVDESSPCEPQEENGRICLDA